MQSLRDGSFLGRRENVLVFGKPGSGKTHALCALGEQLILQGRSVYFASCSLLVQELLAAKRDLKLEKVVKRLAGFEALILDDLGYVQQSREEMEVLFTLLAERYERGSVLLTSNLPFSQWTQIFKDPMTTAAAIDRLVHHSVIVELNALVRARSTPQAMVFRCRIVLMAAQPEQPTNQQVADALDCDRHTVGQWRERYVAHGLTGLQDAPRSGRPRSFSPPPNDSTSSRSPVVRLKTISNPTRPGVWTISPLKFCVTPATVT